MKKGIKRAKRQQPSPSIYSKLFAFPKGRMEKVNFAKLEFDAFESGKKEARKCSFFIWKCPRLKAFFALLSHSTNLQVLHSGHILVPKLSKTFQKWACNATKRQLCIGNFKFRLFCMQKSCKTAHSKWNILSWFQLSNAVLSQQHFLYVQTAKSNWVIGICSFLKVRLLFYSKKEERRHTQGTGFTIEVGMLN